MTLFYPSAPVSLIAAWNNRHSFQANTLKQQYNGGTEDRGTGFGIGVSYDTWSFDIKVVGFANYLALHNFFLERDGKPFYIDFDGNGAPGGLYKTSSYQWTWESSEIFSLSIELTGVNRP